MIVLYLTLIFEILILILVWKYRYFAVISFIFSFITLSEVILIFTTNINEENAHFLNSFSNSFEYFPEFIGTVAFFSDDLSKIFLLLSL